MATEKVTLRVRDGGANVPLNSSSGSPYYVGARAYVEQNEDGATITITDKEGTTTATVYNGQDGATGATGATGADGKDGVDGADGFSPIATVEREDDRAIIVITDKNGTTTATVFDGESSGAGAFIAEWNATTYEDVYDAWNAGMSIFCEVIVGDTTFRLSCIGFDSNSNSFGFCSEIENTERWAMLSEDEGWDAWTNQLFSGNYNDLTNKPTIPSNVSDLINDSGFSSVSISRKVSTGENIADITIDGTTTKLYAPTGGGGTVTDVQVDGSSVVVGGVAEIDLTGKADVADIPTVVSDLTNDAGYITGYTETDPIFLASAAAGIASSDISAWNGKSDFSGSYNDLTNKPTIPSKVSDLTNDSGFSSVSVLARGSVGTNIADITIDGVTKKIYSPENVFYATLGTTTYAELNTAYIQGKLLMLMPSRVWLTAYDGSVFSFIGFDTISRYVEATLDSEDTWDIIYKSAPSKTSDLTNDSGFITSAAVPSKTSDLTNDSGFITSADVPQEVYWATYGTTTNAQIEAAYQADKIVCVNKGDKIYTLAYRENATGHLFVATVDSDFYKLTCHNNTWTEDITHLAPLNSNDKITDYYLPDYHDIYWATYGTTTNAEVNTALNAGKIVYAIYGSVFCPLTKVSGSASHEFSCIDNGIEYRITLINGVWTSAMLPASGIFWATYGTTTSAEIEAAIDAGKFVCVHLNDNIYILSYGTPYLYLHRFCCSFTNGVGIIQCYNDVWTVYGEAYFIDNTTKGAAYGVCPLDANGKVDVSYLPVYNGGVS